MAIYEELHPETRHDSFKGNQHSSGSRQVGDNQPADRFTVETAAATGKSERSVQRDAERNRRRGVLLVALLKPTAGAPNGKPTR